MGNSSPNDNISYSSSCLLTAYHGLWATLSQRQHQLQQQLFAHGLSGAGGNSFPNDNISYSSSSLPTAYQGLWATLPPTTTSATAAALCPRPIRGCGQLFPQRQHQLQQQLFAHGLSGAVGNSSPNDNISYSSSSLPTAYQGLVATLSPTTTSATAAALCPRPIRGCGQLFPNDDISYSYNSSSLPTAYQGLWATVPPTTTSAVATTAALCPRPIRGCGQLVPQRQHQLQLQQQLFAHGLSGAVGNSSPNDNTSYNSSSLPTAYQGLWATVPPTITSATATTAALCPRPIRGCGQLFPQRQHQLQQQLFAHSLSGAVGNSFPNDNISYSSSSLSTAYQGLWATLSPTITSATAAALCPRPIRGCGQFFPQRQHQLQQQLFVHGLSGSVGNSFPNDNISYSSSSLPTAYQGLWATLSPTITSATAAALCPRPIRGCGQLFPQR